MKSRTFFKIKQRYFTIKTDLYIYILCPNSSLILSIQNSLNIESTFNDIKIIEMEIYVTCVQILLLFFLYKIP